MNIAQAITKIRTYPRLGLVLLAYVAFIALGMPDGLLGVAWPSIRASFGIPLDAIGSLLAAGTVGYLISSFVSGTVISRLGVGRVLAASCALTGLALIGYTLVPEWWMMVLLGVSAGLGAGAIDAGLNTYMADNFGEGLMQWLHASYGVGITSGPLIMTAAISGMQSWRTGYGIVGGFQLILATTFMLTLGMWRQDKRDPESDAPMRLTDYKTPLGETLLQPRVWQSLALFLLYVGAEVTLGTWSYTLLTESRGIPGETAGLVTGSYWAMFTIGRVLAGLYARRLGVHTLVMGSLFGGLAGALLIWWNPSDLVSLAGIALVGFSIAPIFPGLVSGTSKRVGERFAANTIGMQMTAAGLGFTVIPGLFGWLAQQTSLEIIPVCLAVVFVLMLGIYRLGQ